VYITSLAVRTVTGQLNWIERLVSELGFCRRQKLVSARHAV